MKHHVVMDRQAVAIRRLALSVEPATDESFFSWIDQLATQNATDRLAILSYFGLTNGSGNPESETGFKYEMSGGGVSLTDQQMSSLVQGTGVTAKRISRTLLRRFDERIARMPPVGSGRDLNNAARKYWLLQNASLACPSCLREAPDRWSIFWKVPWSFACIKHGSFLISACDECGGPLEKRNQSLAQRHQCCNVISATVRANAESDKTVCNRAFAAIEQSPADGEATEAQALLYEFMDCDDERTEEAFRFFSSLRALVPLVLYFGETAGLATASPASIVKRFADHVADRESEGMGTRSNPRAYRFGPRDPLLMAASIRLLQPLITKAQTPENWAETVVTHSRTREDWHNRWQQNGPKFTLDPPLRQALDSALRNAGVGRKRRFNVVHDAAQPNAGLAQRVPQIIFDQTYESLQLALPRGISKLEVQKALSIFLARMMDPEIRSLQMAADHLGLSSPQGASNLRTRATRLGTFDSIVASLEQLATQLRDDPQAANYAQRRAVIGGVSELEEAHWHAIRATLKARNKRITERNKPLLTVLLWEVFTRSDYKLCPIWERHRDLSSAYFTFRMLHAETLREVMDQIGKEILAGRDSPGRQRELIANP